MLVGHLNPPHGPLSSSLTMIDVSSFLSPRPSFSFFFLTCPAGSLPAPPPPSLYSIAMCFCTVELLPISGPDLSCLSVLLIYDDSSRANRSMASVPYLFKLRNTHGKKEKPGRNSRNLFFFQSFFEAIQSIFPLFFIKR
jgi:hypothetical protein